MEGVLESAMIKMRELIIFSLLMVVAVPFAYPVDIDLRIISKMESSNNPWAYNPKDPSYGLCAITPFVLMDFNSSYDYNYQINDLYNPQTNLMIAKWYFKEIEKMLRHYHIPVTLDNVLASYNCGIGRVRQNKIPPSTKRYIATYKREASHVQNERVNHVAVNESGTQDRNDGKV